MNFKILEVADSFSKYSSQKSFLEKNGFTIEPCSDYESLLQGIESHQNIPFVIFFSGEKSDPAWRDVCEVKVQFPWVPVLCFCGASSKLWRACGKSETLVALDCVGSNMELLQSIHRIINAGQNHKKGAYSVLATHPPKQSLFFDTLEINKILDKALAHFGSKILCKNIHWIQWSEIQHLSEADADSLSLEVEAKYHRTPRIRSLHYCEIRDVVHLAREFPLVKKMNHLAGGGFLTRGSDPGHLLFPIFSQSYGGNISCLLIENLHEGDPEVIVKLMRETIDFMLKQIEFGYKYWEAVNQSYYDDLTNLYNQRYLPKVLDNEVSRAKRSCTKFSVLFLDLDHFKMVNDNKGHWVGSKLLVEVGKVVSDSIRSCDYGFRYGGDEFVVVLVDTDVQGGEIVAERIRKSIEESVFLVDGHGIRLTVSVGVACYPDHADSRQAIIKMADEAMYLGKHKSRNVVFVAS